jgi:mRNA interferase MazF
MGFRRGAIHLANFNPSKGTEAGKIRPCLILQSDLLNEVDHPSTTVLPLTTQLIDDAEPLRFRIKARGSLQADSDVMIDQARTIDNTRITIEALLKLTNREITEIEEYLKIVLGFGEQQADLL